jgi:chromosome segregation ATPase
MDTDEFLDNVNSTPRKLGHNKLQLEIDNLNSKITELSKTISQKDIKISLFTQTINTLQLQLTDKSNEISSLTEQLHTVQLERSDFITKMNNKMSTTENTLHSTKETLNDLCCEMKSCCTEINTLTDIVSDCKQQNENNIQEITLLKHTIDSNILLINDLESQLKSVRDDCTLKDSIATNLQSEITFLKSQVKFYKDKFDEQSVHFNDIQLQLQHQLSSPTEPEPDPDPEPTNIPGIVKRKNILKKRK